MISARVVVLCLFACLLGIEGVKRRLQARTVEIAHTQVGKEQVFGNMTKETETEDAEDEGTLRPKRRCKRWCTTAQMGSSIDFVAAEKQIQGNCDFEKCKACKHCRKPEVTVEVRKADETQGASSCVEHPTELAKGCSLKEREAKLICTHVNTPWCMPPSRNPGQKYRFGSQPLCCETTQSMSEYDMAHVEEKATNVLKSLKVKADEPPAPVPVCAVGHTFEAEVLDAGMVVCRDRTNNRFAQNVCCEAGSLKLLEDKFKAEALCPTVVKKFCKPDIKVFEKKRNKKYPEMPSTFSCRRMYMCCEGDDCVGPVPSLSWCEMAKTKLSKNRQATRTCVAVPL